MRTEDGFGRNERDAHAKRTRRRSPKHSLFGQTATSLMMHQESELADHLVSGDRPQPPPGAVDARPRQRLLRRGVPGVDVLADESHRAITQKAMHAADVP